MKKIVLRYVLRSIAQEFEKLATSEQITKFKNKYSGMHWHETVSKDLLTQVDTAVAMKRWIDNIVRFMMEHRIVEEPWTNSFYSYRDVNQTL